MNSIDIKNLINSLENADANDDKVFHAVIRQSVQVLEIVASDLNRPFSCSIPSVQRWINGSSAPHPALRPTVYTELIKLANEKLSAMVNEDETMNNLDIKNLIADLEDADANDDKVFYTVIRRAMQVLETPTADVAEVIGVARPTLARWVAAASSPHPTIRPAIYRGLIRLANEKLEKMIDEEVVVGC